MFCLLALAMFVAFSLSWASPASLSETVYAIPEKVVFPPENWPSYGKPEITAVIAINDTCESVDQVTQETRGHKVIFAVRMKNKNNDLCFQDQSKAIVLSIPVEAYTADTSSKMDVYFRGDEESLKYFGFIKTKKDLLTKN